MVNLNSVMIGSEKPEKLVEFYKKVLDKDPDWNDGGYAGFGSESMALVIGPHDKVKGKSDQPARVIINFTTDEVEAEFERIKGFAPKVVAEPYSMDGDTSGMKIATLEDPDGNYFQLMTPMKMDLPN
jgi:predicted enzyme related to lactoylglutathione lyase